MENLSTRLEGQHQRLIAVSRLIRLPGQRLAAAERADPAVAPLATLFQQAVSEALCRRRRRRDELGLGDQLHVQRWSRPGQSGLAR